MSVINVELPVAITGGSPEYGVFPLGLEDDRPLSEYPAFICKMFSVPPGEIRTRSWQLQFGTGMDDYGHVVGDPLDLAKTLRAQGIHAVDSDAGSSEFPGANSFAPTIRVVDLDDATWVIQYPHDRFGETTLPDRHPLS